MWLITGPGMQVRVPKVGMTSFLIYLYTKHFLAILCLCWVGKCSKWSTGLGVDQLWSGRACDQPSTLSDCVASHHCKASLASSQLIARSPCPLWLFLDHLSFLRITNQLSSLHSCCSLVYRPDQFHPKLIWQQRDWSCLFPLLIVQLVPSMNKFSHSHCLLSLSSLTCFVCKQNICYWMAEIVHPLHFIYLLSREPQLFRNIVFLSKQSGQLAKFDKKVH